MWIDVARLDEAGETLVGEEAESILDLEPEALAKPAGPLRYRLRAQVVSGELLVSGTLAMDIQYVCSRCAEPFVAKVEDQGFERACEVSENTEFVDLTPDIRESILLAFSSHPVCRSDCRGLCAQCGANLNKTKCKCHPPADFRWSGLDHLKI